MSDTIIVAVLSLIGTLAGSFGGTQMIKYRIEQLEKKVEKHNSVVERTYLLEEKINRAIGNEWFRTKVSTKLKNKTGYIDSKYPLARALVSQYQNTNKPYWKKDERTSRKILQRQRQKKRTFVGGSADRLWEDLYCRAIYR